MPALLPQASAGLFGKLPSRGDFVREGLSRGFTDAWDEWWQRGLAATQERPEEEWLAAWLEAPVWRFVLPPGLLGSEGVLGLWLPSVDKVGRYYPLTIAAEAQGDWAPLVGAMEDFLASAEEAGRDALEIDLEPAELGRRVREAFVVGERHHRWSMSSRGASRGGPTVGRGLRRASKAVRRSRSELALPP